MARMPGFCVMPEGGFTSTRPDPRAAPPVVSGTTLFCPAGATLGVPTDVDELCPGRGAVTGSPG